jgi:hypothetical protein
MVSINHWNVIEIIFEKLSFGEGAYEGLQFFELKYSYLHGNEL